MISPSSGTAHVLGLKSIKMEDPPTCAYLMLGSHCQGKCLFCSQSSVAKKGDFLSRITWKPEEDEKIFSSLEKCENNGTLQRICLQVVRGDDSYSKTVETIKNLKNYTNLPVCVSINGVGFSQIEELIRLNIDKIAFSFDAATATLFEKIKGEKWQNLWNLYEKTAEEYPEKVVIHLIAGLGETEAEMVETLKTFCRQKTPVSLFAFTPLRGTPLGGENPPPLTYYRRLQTAYYLMREWETGNLKINPDEIFQVNSGKITFPENMKQFLRENIPSEAFQTYGCSGCNRPLYNERPGQIPYNYPRKLTEEERIAAIPT